jgi:protein-S-isoprenylcysteine O-methyltransferase Ste14
VRSREGEHPWGDVGQLVLLGLFLVVWVGDSFFWRATTSLAGIVPLAIRLAVFALVLAGAVILARSGHTVVDRGRRSEGVVSSAAFRYVRHPLYLGSVLFFVALAVSTASLGALALTAVLFAFYDHIATYEERWLEARYGEAYRSYRSRTGKWWPRGGGVPGAGGES